MSGLPFNTRVEMAFTSDISGPNSGSPVYTDITQYVTSIKTVRGRDYLTDAPAPGTMTMRLLNSDGRFDPNNPAGPYFGNIRQNRKVRVSAQATSTSPRVYLWTGYTDAWAPTLPAHNQPVHYVDVTATDRFKILARRTNISPRPTNQESSASRLASILLAGGVPGPPTTLTIIPSTEYSLNADGYAARTLARKTYDAATSTFDNVKEVAINDGGAIFMAGDGTFTFQTYAYRTTKPLSTTSQATYGTLPGAIPCEPTAAVRVDVGVLANYVSVTDTTGVARVDQDTTLQNTDGIYVLDIGQTLLLAADAASRATALLNLRKNPGPRYQSVTLDAFADATRLNEALTREISDRVTISVIPLGVAQGTARQVFIEKIIHDITVTGWRTTFDVSPTGAAGVTIP